MTDRAMLQGALNVAQARKWDDLVGPLELKLRALDSVEKHNKLVGDLQIYLGQTTSVTQEERAQHIPSIFEKHGWIAPDLIYLSWDEVPEGVVVADRDQEHWVHVAGVSFLREHEDADFWEVISTNPHKYVPFRRIGELTNAEREHLNAL